MGVPRIIHYCWYGPRCPSRLAMDCIRTWRREGYAVARWDERNTPALPYVAKALEKRKWGPISDLMRLWVLQEFGGIYLDTDVELLKSFPAEMLDQQMFLGWMSERTYHTAVLGAELGHPVIKDMLTKLLCHFDGSQWGPESGSGFATAYFERYGLKNLGRPVTVAGKDGSFTVYPERYFYPLPARRGKARHDGEVCEETVAIHHWEGSWKVDDSRWPERR